MRNVEQLEYELTQLNGKTVILVVPGPGTTSFSYIGNLAVVEMESHTVGFHITASIGGWAIIFFAEDVEALQDPVDKTYTKTIRILKKA